MDGEILLLCARYMEHCDMRTVVVAGINQTNTHKLYSRTKVEMGLRNKS